MTVNSEIAVLDACVLYPAPLRDLLLSLAAEDLYRARWTEMIQNEWITAVLSHRQDLQAAALHRTATLMNRAIENSLVLHYEHLIDSLVLPDPEDRHVLAAAITCRANAIVTFNKKDFGQQANITIVHPDDFCVSLFARSEADAQHAVKTLRQRLKNPPKTARELITTYEQQGLPKLATLLQDKLNLL
ncbi:PIN domain-containing protein [Duganella sp. sic0402]|uniref:PIN domain-containing protein n=1 Tax=Duganella sp. sic0402 TaxID=2854786 RepID=UPI001C47B801|nr:PIN domain-containing protein [Duganella sp. sic0402]MBV7538503.1 PIN domain-containing protein [Duganella sp. sic0402]